MTSQRHYSDLGSDTSSLWNFSKRLDGKPCVTSVTSSCKRPENNNLSEDHHQTHEKWGCHVCLTQAFCHSLLSAVLQHKLTFLRGKPVVMHQSIPAAPSPPPPTPPGLLRGICSPFQSRGWGICKFCTTGGPGICQSGAAGIDSSITSRNVGCFQFLRP